MSFSFDVMARAFLQCYAANEKDERQNYLFHRLIEEVHSANHELDDTLNRNPRIRRAASRLDQYLTQKYISEAEAQASNEPEQGGPDEPDSGQSKSGG